MQSLLKRSPSPGILCSMTFGSRPRCYGPKPWKFERVRGGLKGWKCKKKNQWRFEELCFMKFGGTQRFVKRCSEVGEFRISNFQDRALHRPLLCRQSAQGIWDLLFRRGPHSARSLEVVEVEVWHVCSFVLCVQVRELIKMSVPQLLVFPKQ